MPKRYVKSQYGAAKQSNRTPAKFRVNGHSNKCNKTPHKLSAIRGLWHSKTFLVIALTPPHTINNAAFNTPISHSIAKHALSIRSPSSMPLSPNDTSDRTIIGLIISGEIDSIFRICTCKEKRDCIVNQTKLACSSGISTNRLLFVMH